MTNDEIKDGIINADPWAYYMLAQLELAEQCQIMKQAVRLNYTFITSHGPLAGHWYAWVDRCGAYAFHLEREGKL